MIRGTGAEAIASDVEAAISAGALAPGAELPPIRELAGQLGVNANTVAAAYRLLRQRGAVETAGRRGTRVRNRPATTPRSLRGIAVPSGARDLSTGNPNPALLPIAGLSTRRSAPVLYGDPPVSAELAEFARTSLTADGVPAEHIAVTAGALDGIERVLAAHLRPGDRVAVEDPGWANLLDLLAALGFSAEPVRVDDDGPLTADVDRALRRGARALVLTTRAQNPTGAAVSSLRARRSCERCSSRMTTCCSSKTTTAQGSPAHRCTPCPALPGTGRSSARPRRPTVPTCDWHCWPATNARSNGCTGGCDWAPVGSVTSCRTSRSACGATRPPARLVHNAEVAYTRNRELLRGALADRGVTSHGRSGLNVWIPVPDETVSITRLLSAGWAAAPGTRFRIGSPPGMRITISGLAAEDIDALADAIAEAVLAVGRASM